MTSECKVWSVGFDERALDLEDYRELSEGGSFKGDMLRLERNYYSAHWYEHRRVTA